MTDKTGGAGTMTPDIQELKKRALAAKEAGLTHPASLKELHALNAMGAIASPSTILALIEVTEAAQKLVSAVDDLIAESHGVYGLHQNGDIAPWDTLIEGGQFEDWLLPLSVARAALTAHKEKSDV